MSDFVTIRIGEDERYPYYSVEDLRLTYAGPRVAVHYEKLRRWERVMQEFEEVQEEMAAAVDAVANERSDP